MTEPETLAHVQGRIEAEQKKAWDEQKKQRTYEGMFDEEAFEQYQDHIHSLAPQPRPSCAVPRPVIEPVSPLRDRPLSPLSSCSDG
jgi:hypothetical protein